MKKESFGKGARALVTLSVLASGCRAVLEPPVKTVHIPGGTGIVGRTAEEVDAAYKECQEIAERTNQPGMCDPKEAVFGDVSPAREIVMPDMDITEFELPGLEGGMPEAMTFTEAQAACEDLGGRIPTDYEWEFAARGQGRHWPWGNEAPTEDRANMDIPGGNPDQPKAPSGSYPQGATPEGVQDMTGNLWDWVTDHETGAPERKGGSAGTIPPFAEPAHQLTDPAPDTTAGVRCVFPDREPVNLINAVFVTWKHLGLSGAETR